MEPKFIPGLELSELLYQQAVRPLLDKYFPGLVYSAGLIGPGSDVLGFDTSQSMDHDWGPRLMLFLNKPDHVRLHEQVDQMLREHLPPQVEGFSTNFGRHEDGTGAMRIVDGPPINHRVRILTAIGYFTSILGFDPSGEISAVDWVSGPANHLLILTSGRIFYDGLGQLEPLREKLKYYPHDVWLYLLAAQWRRIAQEEHFVGRCAQVGDDLGSCLVATRLVHDMMYWSFLAERCYPPYIKWFGSAFSRLKCSGRLAPILTRVLYADQWEQRQAYLVEAYEFLAGMHNQLGITPPLETKASQFYSRPFLVIHADRFVDAIRAAIKDDEVVALPEHLGSFDQFIDSTDAEGYLDRIKSIYKLSGIA